MDELQKVINQRSNIVMMTLNLKDIYKAAYKVTVAHQDMYKIVNRLSNRILDVTNEFETKMLKIVKLDSDIKDQQKKISHMSDLMKSDPAYVTDEFLDEQMKTHTKLNDLMAIYNKLYSQLETYEEGLEHLNGLNNNGCSYIKASETSINFLTSQVLGIAPALMSTMDAFATEFAAKEGEI